MQGMLEQLPDLCKLHYSPGIEDDYLVGHLGYNTEIMGDEQNG